MPSFTNRATLSYNGTSTNSNTVTGNLTEVLSATKTAILNDYASGDDITYVISITNAGVVPYTDLTITDNLGAYPFAEGTLTPLTYQDNSLHYYVNGILQTTLPTVVAGPPLVISGVTVPAQGNVILIYEAAVNEFAPLGLEDSITNSAVITGGCLVSDLTIDETVLAESTVNLTISKAICPAELTGCSQVTYTFVIQNSGNTPAEADDNVTLTDIFDPILSNISVTFNGQPWDSTNYTYNPDTGEFATVSGRITVPAAEYIRQEDGSFVIDPGVSTLVITGTL